MEPRSTIVRALVRPTVWTWGALLLLAGFADACELSVEPPDADAPEASAGFDDVAGTTHEEAIAAVTDAGIATGFDDDTYRPDQPVTRGQMATFLDRALDLD